MDWTLIALCTLTFVIHSVGTLAYAVRIAGVRTRRVAVSFALFNVMVLVSRVSNSLQGPFLAKRIEVAIHRHVQADLLRDFQWLLVSSTLGTIVAAFLVPTFQRLFSTAVAHFQIHRSVPKLVMRALVFSGTKRGRSYVTMPSVANLQVRKEVSNSVTILNIVSQALGTVGVFAALYAGAIDPAYRVTASTLAPLINGVATILLIVFIDPYLSVMTDDVVEGRTTEAAFRRAVVWLTGTRIVGTIVAQALLVPAAILIAAIATHL